MSTSTLFPFPASNESPLISERLAHGAILPRWWGMEWDTERIALRIYVHRYFLDNDRHASLLPYRDEIDSLLSGLGFGLSDFSGDLRDLHGFGINRAFIPVDVVDAECSQFAEFLVPYPQVDHMVGACDRCEEYGGMEHCISCQGTGERREIDWKDVHGISLSLYLFFHMVQFPEILLTGDEPQLMEIEVSTSSDRAGISGEFSLPLRAWLSSCLRGSRIDQMERAMAQAHARLFGLPNVDEATRNDLFRASVDFHGGWLNCGCPGLSGGCNSFIHPNHISFASSPGYEFLSRMDTPMEMLTILAGLAALHGIVDPVWRATMPVPSRRAAS